MAFAPKSCLLSLLYVRFVSALSNSTSGLVRKTRENPVINATIVWLCIKNESIYGIFVSKNCSFYPKKVRVEA